MRKPTRGEIRAVRRALYGHKHIAKLKSLRTEISTIMNLNHDQSLAQHDIRNPPGSGPNWIIRANGAIDPAVLRGADLCDEVAQTMLAIRHAVQGVSFPQADKVALLEALRQEAASWTARGRAWRAPSSPDVTAAVNDIDHHVQAGMQASRHLQHYFRPNQDVFG